MRVLETLPSFAGCMAANEITVDTGEEGTLADEGVDGDELGEGIFTLVDIGEEEVTPEELAESEGDDDGVVDVEEIEDEEEARDSDEGGEDDNGPDVVDEVEELVAIAISDDIASRDSSGYSKSNTIKLCSAWVDY